MALPEFLERESIVAIEASILVRLFAIFAISVRRPLFYPPKILTLLRSRKRSLQLRAWWAATSLKP